MKKDGAAKRFSRSFAVPPRARFRLPDADINGNPIRRGPRSPRVGLSQKILRGVCALMLAICAIAPPLFAQTPGVIQQDRLTAPDLAAGAAFGASVGVSEDTAVIGSPGPLFGGREAAYVFERHGPTWCMRGKLTATDLPPTGSGFGSSVAISNQTVVVGAYVGPDGRGAVFVYREPAGGWRNGTQTATLTGSDVQASEQFGKAVAIDGDTIVVGAWRAGSFQRGAVYVFVRPVGGWSGELTQTGKLTVAAPVNSENLGLAVAVWSNVIVAGAPGALGNGRGAAYVFERPAEGWRNMTETAILRSGDAQPLASVGTSVAVADGVIVAGAPSRDATGAADAGAAYVFQHGAARWTSMAHTAMLTAATPASGAMLGASVRIADTRILAGSPRAAAPAGAEAGAAMLYVRPPSGWRDAAPERTIVPAGVIAGEHFGESLASTAEHLLIGSPARTGPSGNGEGVVTAWSFDTDADGVPDDADVCPGTPPGWTVSPDGRPKADWNNDCRIDGSDIRPFVEQLLGR